MLTPLAVNRVLSSHLGASKLRCMAPDRGLPLLEPPTGRERSGRVGGATLLGILALISLRWLGAPHSSSPPQNVGLHPNEPAAGGGAATLGPAGAAVVTVQQAEPTRLAIAAEPPGSATARPNSKVSIQPHFAIQFTQPPNVTVLTVAARRLGHQSRRKSTSMPFTCTFSGTQRL